MRQEDEHCRTFSQLLFEEAGLCPGGLQPMEDGLVVLKHPAADGLGGEVPLTSGENLTVET